MVAMWQDRAALSVTRLLYGTQNLSVKRRKQAKRKKLLTKRLGSFTITITYLNAMKGKSTRRKLLTESCRWVRGAKGLLGIRPGAAN